MQDGKGRKQPGSRKSNVKKNLKTGGNFAAN